MDVLNTPSEAVQRAVSDCLSPLMASKHVSNFHCFVKSYHLDVIYYFAKEWHLLLYCLADSDLFFISIVLHCRLSSPNFAMEYPISCFYFLSLMILILLFSSYIIFFVFFFFFLALIRKMAKLLYLGFWIGWWKVISMGNAVEQLLGLLV